MILHGPNGVGKTRLLELVRHTFDINVRKLAQLPFVDARFEFDDSAWIEVSRAVETSDEPLETSELMQAEALLRVDRCGALHWRTRTRAGDISEYTIEVGSGEQERRFGHLEPLWRRISVNQSAWTFLDSDDPDIIEISEDTKDTNFDRILANRVQENLRDFVTEFNVHLIETQRLLNSRYQRRSRHSNTRSSDPPTVVTYAENLTKRLAEALAMNSRRSQELDRSFPSKLLDEAQANSLFESESQIRDRYAQQLALRSRLASIAILDASPELNLPERELETWERRVLSTYLDDTERKLATFEDLGSRLELMKEIINERFLFKRFEIDRETGFAFYDEDLGSRLDITHLSSGEQHELVLMYDLLMKVGEHSLVLIDEPEISLHVAWQKAFLDDLDRIASLTSLRFIIATHSPQIIGSWWDQAVELYRV